MSTKKGGRTRCPKCYRRMSKPSRFEWFGVQAGPIQIPRQQPAWQTICLACVREHFADPLLHLRAHKRDSVRLKDDFPNGRSWIPSIRTPRTTCPERH